MVPRRCILCAHISKALWELSGSPGLASLGGGGCAEGGGLVSRRKFFQNDDQPRPHEH